MIDPRAALAQVNNVDWYVEESESLAIPYERHAEYWLSSAVLPPFHSNLLWASTREPFAQIDQLKEKIVGPWSIKDAHAQFDLTSVGFDLLFNAQWYWLATDRMKELAEPKANDELQVQTVTTQEGFDLWERCWGETPPGERVFHPQLWRRPNVNFHFARSPDGVVQGGIASNRSAETMGMTNCFGEVDAIAACITLLAQAGLPIVGYDRLEDIFHLAEMGFETTGDLAIWVLAAS